MTREEAIERIKNDIEINHNRLANEYITALNMAIEALQQPTVQTIQDSCITIYGISSKYLEDKHDGKILVYTEKGCRTYHWFGDDEQ